MIDKYVIVVPKIVLKVSLGPQKGRNQREKPCRNVYKACILKGGYRVPLIQVLKLYRLYSQLYCVSCAKAVELLE